MSYNVQPGITIDYRIGDSYETATGRTSGQIRETWVANSAWVVFVLNKKSRKFHAVSCPAVQKISPQHGGTGLDTRRILISCGYLPCGVCGP